MNRVSVDQPDLFAWAETRPIEVAEPPIGNEQVVDFLARRPSLPRWILGERRDLKAFDLWYGRKTGEIPPAPILPFTREHPASPGSYSSAPTRRQG